jgi:hypothetical protein
MGNANIDSVLKKQIEEFLKDNTRARIKYQNVKGFIDNACSSELDKAKKDLKK